MKGPYFLENLPQIWGTFPRKFGPGGRQNEGGQISWDTGFLPLKNQHT